MALSYGFYNSYNGDRKYNAEQISSMFDGLINDGVFEEIDEKLWVVPGDGMQVIVKSGKAWFDKTWLVNSSEYPINIPQGDLSRDRIDAVVVETDHRQENRRTSIKIVMGESSVDPKKPVLMNTDEVHQHPLAYVKVRSGATQISLNDLENRIGMSDCPFITGLLEVTSLDDLFAAWGEQFQKFVVNRQGDFDSFMAASSKRVDDWINNTQTEFLAWWNDINQTIVTDVDTAAALTVKMADVQKAVRDENEARVASDNNLQSQITSMMSTKQNRIDTVGLLKGNGSGSIVKATEGTDYMTVNTGKWTYAVFTETTTWNIPSDLINPVHVIVMGGGGGGGFASGNSDGSYTGYRRAGGGGGGGGYFNEGDYNLSGSSVSITIGKGGAGGDGGNSPTPATIANGGTGGTTRFGSYISASGGQGGQGRKGGAGGAGGGGGGQGSSMGDGGKGYQFGGGAGAHGGGGGTWGGGGATIMYTSTISGGTYGGRGGAIDVEATGGARFAPSIWYQMLFPSSLETGSFSKGGGTTGGGGGFGGNGQGGGGGYGCEGGYGSIEKGWGGNKEKGGGGGYGPIGPQSISSTDNNADYIGQGGGGICMRTQPSMTYLVDGNYYWISYANGGFGGGQGSQYSFSPRSGGDGICIVFYRKKG